MSDKAKGKVVWFIEQPADDGEPVLFFDNIHPSANTMAMEDSLPAMREAMAIAARNDAWSNAARAERGVTVGDSWIDCFGDHREG